LVSTGSSSWNAVEALRDAGCEVLGMVAIFTYGFPQAAENFKNANVQLDTLTDYGTMIEMAVEQDYVKENQLDTLKQWRLQPETWGR
ncbi:MAG: orotate phosphoribosyltransferase, partial [Rikenellaceae bacterium]|nr:orotate phosphoribosyltransferase [Rikenellaceae bacterium]